MRFYFFLTFPAVIYMLTMNNTKLHASACFLSCKISMFKQDLHSGVTRMSFPSPIIT